MRTRTCRAGPGIRVSSGSPLVIHWLQPAAIELKTVLCRYTVRGGCVQQPCTTASSRSIKRCTPPPTAPSLSSSLPPSPFFCSQADKHECPPATYRGARLTQQQSSRRHACSVRAPYHRAHLLEYKPVYRMPRGKCNDAGSDIITAVQPSRFSSKLLLRMSLMCAEIGEGAPF